MAIDLWNEDGSFGGIGPEFEPDWLFTDRQKALQADLIELSRTTLRPNAIESDEGYIFPRKNFEALAELGVLSLNVPQSLGGMGENHVATAMVVETIARYGCPSTAMCFVMHSAAVAAGMLRHHDNAAIQDLMTRLDKECLVGTLSLSDPATGSHVWFLLSSSAERDGEGYKLSKKASWTTSGGYADWYIAQTTSPDYGGNYADFSTWLVMSDEVTANPGSWDGMGLRGNQSGPIEITDIKVAAERLVGPVGDGATSNDEATDPFFLFGTAACWNGIALGMIDIARRHTTRKRHVDVGLRVCDYPTIQDYVGNAIITTNASRMLTYSTCRQMDETTNNCDWSIHADPAVLPRAELIPWSWSTKYTASSNLTAVSDKMLHACGGTAYKAGIGMERLLRDGKAGWLMAPTNEVVRNFLGRAGLMGFEALDLWNQNVDQRSIDNEIKKMTPEEKRTLAERLLAE